MLSPSEPILGPDGPKWAHSGRDGPPWAHVGPKLGPPHGPTGKLVSETKGQNSGTKIGNQGSLTSETKFQKLMAIIQKLRAMIQKLRMS